MTSSSLWDGLVMIKPIGPRCNLRCGYCYYLEKEERFPGGSRLMSTSVLEQLVAQRFASSPGPVTHFEWHGGEPTLAGLPFFQLVVKLQRRLAPPGRRYTNGLQTNGLALDPSWVRFLADHQFSVGLSLDGNAQHHHLRRRPDGGTSHPQVMVALNRLRSAGVFTNLLAVVHSRNADDPDGVFDFFRSTGITHWQFLPFVSRPGTDGSLWQAPPGAVGRFLCRIYDRWLVEGVGSLVIQNIDEALRPLYGVPHALCVHRPTCGEAVVLEHDGSFYSCDHFVDPDHRIGSLVDTSLADLGNDPRVTAFGLAKQGGMACQCQDCSVLAFCNGGCPKDRDVSGLNRLCADYRAYFSHVQPGLSALADHMKAGRALRTFRFQP